MSTENDGPKIIDAETPEPRIVAVEDPGPTRTTPGQTLNAGLQPAKDDEDVDDDPAEPDAPGDPDTDNEAENEPEGDGDNAPGKDAPAEIQL